jgi:hypothetical protein
MDSWKDNFAHKLQSAQSNWNKQFETVLDEQVVPVFEDIASFVRDHGFATSIPLHDDGKRSFKFELAENAYLLMIFRSSGIGEFELRCEAFAPGAEPGLSKSIERLADVNKEWSQQKFQSALDGFVSHLNGKAAGNADAKAEPELATV